MPFGGGDQRTPRSRAPLTRSHTHLSGFRPLTVAASSTFGCALQYSASIPGVDYRRINAVPGLGNILGDLRSAQRTAGHRYLGF
jgi:hypothetical protein